MSEWIDVNDRLPTDHKMKRYIVKMTVGSVHTKEMDAVVLGKMTATGFRFMSGDWKTVTHWKEFDTNSVTQEGKE